MAGSWFRLWHDMPNDPKWRTIARKSNQRIGDVISVYLHVLVNVSSGSETECNACVTQGVTSGNEDERGRIKNLCADDIASSLDLETEQVEQILAAMQGKVLDGDLVVGWAKRQPKREDGSAARVKAYRERKRAEKEAVPSSSVTQGNACVTQGNAPDTDTDTDTDTEKEIVHGASAEADDHPQQARISESRSGLSPEQPATPELGLNPDRQKNPVSGLTPELLPEPTAGLNPERASGPVPVAEKINYESILDAYHELLPEMPRVKILTEGRKKHIRTLWKKYHFDDGRWRAYLSYIAANCRWMLEERPDGRGGFWKRKNLDYLISERCYVAVREERANDK